MNRLSNLLQLNDGETVASLGSRLSAACGYRHPRSFGADLGFKFQGLAVGNDSDVAKFAECLGVTPSTLAPGVVKSDERFNMMCGEVLTRTLVQRRRLRLCPHCIKEDEEKRSGRRGFRAYGRTEWLVLPVRTCIVHGTRMITAEHVPAPMFGHDFAGNLAVEAANMDAHVAAATPMKADSLQRYVQSRMGSGASSASWLDALLLYVVVRVSEAVGAMDRHGVRYKNSEIDEAEWSQSAGHGFDIMREGEAAFRGHLQKLLGNFYTRNSDMGGRALFGRLYEMLAHETGDPAFDPIRDIMMEVAIGSLPLGPGDEFFGPVTERKVHSVQSASRQYDVHPKRLHKLLLNTGRLDPDAPKNTYERILIDADVMEEFAVETKATLDVTETKAYLGVTRVWFDEMVSHRILSPHGGKGTLDTYVDVIRRFKTDDLDALLHRLRAVVTSQPVEGLVDISAAGRRANCSLKEIFDLLLAGELERVAGRGSETTFKDIRLDPLEVKSKTRLADHNCYNLRQIEKLIPAKTSVVKALVEDGRLPSVKVRNPAKRNIQTVVEPEALAQFVSEFASVGNLARKVRTRTENLERRLRAADVSPAFEAAGTPFYRCTDIELL